MLAACVGFRTSLDQHEERATQEEGEEARARGGGTKIQIESAESQEECNVKLSVVFRRIKAVDSIHNYYKIGETVHLQELSISSGDDRSPELERILLDFFAL